MLKNRLKYFKFLSVFGIAANLPFSFLLSACAQSINNSGGHLDDSRHAIPTSLLYLSSDGKIIYGLRPDVSMRDITMAGYDTLEIPEGVVKIESFAFPYLFDFLSSSINRIILPSSLVEIGDYAFFRCTNIQSIEFNDSVSHTISLKRIGKQAFAECNMSMTLDIPNSVEEIDDYAFNGALYSGKIIIPNSVKKVGFSAFAESSGIECIDFSQYKQIPDWLWHANAIFYNVNVMGETAMEILVNTSIDSLEQWQSALFDVQQLPETSIQFPQVEPKSTPADVLSMWMWDDQEGPERKMTLFGPNYKCNLNNYDILVIPNGAERIQHGAFQDKELKEGKHLTLSMIPSVNEIQHHSFYNAPWLVGSLEIPSGCSIGEHAFEMSNFDDTLFFGSELKISENAFNNTHFKRLAFVQDQIDTKFNGAPFHNCKDLSIIDCSSLDKANFSPRLDASKDFTKNIFADVADCGLIIYPKDGLQHRDMWLEFFKTGGFKGIDNGLWFEFENQFSSPDSTTFDVSDFSCNYNYQTLFSFAPSVDIKQHNILSMPVTVNNIKANAFNSVFNSSEEHKYWQLVLNQGVENIENYAFYNNHNLILFENLPRTIKNIGACAFAYDDHFSFNFELPYAIETIGDSAFFGCTNLWSNNLVIPSTVSFVGNQAFAGWKYIKQITFEPIEEITFGHNVFSNIGYTTVIDLSKMDAVPEKWHYCNDTFNIPDSSGIVYVNNDGVIDGWTTLLTNMGLKIDDTHWSVKVKG